MKRSYRTEAVIGLIVFVVFILGAIFFSDQEHVSVVHSLRTIQEADAPEGYVVDVTEDQPEGRIPEFDRQFVLLDAFERFRLPPVVHFEQPLGSERGSLAYNAQPFMERNPDYGHRHHLGDDLNGIGGMDTDLGDPVYAAGNGVVVFAGEPSPGWGKVVILGHRLHDGRIRSTMYAHLHQIRVARGQVVPRGRAIGSVGTANGSYPAHLHFELYEGPLIDPAGGGYKMFQSNRLNPSEAIIRHQPAPPDHLAPEPLEKVALPPRVFEIGPGIEATSEGA